jgi:hypothetical protein
VRYEGGCHCGAVRFAIDVRDDERDVLDCNCSICAKKGFLHLIVPESRFALVRGADRLATYTFGTHAAKHMFCAACGIHAFYRPRSHPDAWDVNVRCLDDVPLSRWHVRAFDGANWEDAVDEIR